MLGRNHVITNACCVTLLGTGVLYLEHTEFLGKYVNSMAKTVHEFVLPQGTSYTMFIFCVVFFLVGSLLPDIDRMAWVPFSHRTWTHAIWIPILMVPFIIWNHYLFWLAISYVLHLLWDSLSIQGVRFLYPITIRQQTSHGDDAKAKKNHRFKLYKVGSVNETIIVCAMVVITVAITYTFLKF